MARPWNPKQFDTLWERLICQDELHFAGRDYYLRYRSRYQCMVSAYYQGEEPLTSVSGISLLRDHAVETVDLLKIDCEGGEYTVLESTPPDVFSRIRNIVFEYHDIDGGWTKLGFREARGPIALSRRGQDGRSTGYCEAV